MPHNLASYDPTKLRVCNGDVQPEDAFKLLPPHAAHCVRHAADLIERPQSEIDSIAADGGLPVPYWDPTLRSSRTARHDLYATLYRLGILNFRRAIRAHIGLFFVKKKDDRIRLVVDGRQPSARRQAPPSTRLGGGQTLAEIDLSALGLGAHLGGHGEVASIQPHAALTQ